jgi:hypothetical protein
MSDMPEHVRNLLMALVEIEDRARVTARLQGCRCGSDRDPTTGRNLPVAVFNKDRNIGKPLNEIEWEMLHEEGCPMYGQKGVG